MSEDMTYRFLEREIVSDSPQTPSTLNNESRSVNIIISSDNPVVEYDRETDSYWPTVLLPESIRQPKNKQVPLLDCHSRNSTSDQIGSVRNMKVEGPQFVGDAYFADDEKSDRVFNLVKGGHLTDYSIGFRSMDWEYVEEGEKKEFYGRTYVGPVKVVTKSSIQEVSSCPIGADDNAKNRSKKQEQTEERQNMSKSEEKVEAPVEAPVERTAESVDTDAIRKEAQEQGRQAEISRAKEVEALCKELGMDDEFRAEVKDLSVADAKERALKVFAKKNEEIKNVNKDAESGRVEVVRTAEDKYRAGVADALLLRTVGLDDNVSVERKKIANELAGLSLMEICRDLNEQNGSSRYGGARDVVGRALSTSDFPNLLGALANKQLLESFERQDETYARWCDTSGNLRNFQLHNKVRAGEIGDLTQIVEGEAIRYQGRTEQKETVQLSTYAEGYKLTRQAIINDDLSELQDAMEGFGEAVARLYGDTAYAVLTTNGNMGDGNALFSGAHANVGTQGIISETTIGEAIKLMKLQKDIGGKRRLNIQPKYLLSSVKNESASEVFFNSQMFASGATDTTRTNIYAGRFERIYEPRLDDYDSGDPWFLLGPKGKTVKLFFLDGNMSPFMEREKDFDTDCVKWKVRADIGAMAVRWNGMVRNTGA